MAPLPVHSSSLLSLATMFSKETAFVSWHGRNPSIGKLFEILWRVIRWWSPLCINLESGHQQWARDSCILICVLSHHLGFTVRGLDLTKTANITEDIGKVLGTAIVTVGQMLACASTGHSTRYVAHQQQHTLSFHKDLPGQTSLLLIIFYERQERSGVVVYPNFITQESRAGATMDFEGCLTI